jgi:RND superfamily putative drug exporter
VTPRSSTPSQSPPATEAIGLLAALVVLVVAFGTIVAALVPIALALVAVAAGLGSIFLLARQMNVSTAAPTIGAMIGLGVGIDYSLFITARYRENRAAGQTTPRPCPTHGLRRGPRSPSPAAP